MSTSVMKIGGMKVADVISQPTQINIHIHQESSLAKLLQAGSSFLKSKIYYQKTLKQSKKVLRAQLALGVSLILLGVLSCSFGIFLCVGPWIPLQAKDYVFWAGAVAIIAGVGAIIYEKYQSSFWGRLAAMLTVISISTALAAFILCSFSLKYSANHFSNLRELCESSRSEVSTRSQYRRYNYRDWRIEECKSNMDMFLFLFQGVQVMLLVICVMIFLVSLASLGVSLHNLCCQNPQVQVEEGTGRKLLGEESLPPSPCKEKSTGIINL